jgi:21S rRNA (GM2251-2'-O)-methyltransferase
VFIDKVTDPQNFGAILRSCHFYGINKIIVNQQHKCRLNSTVSKTSAGALEIMDIYAVKSTTNFF